MDRFFRFHGMRPRDDAKRRGGKAMKGRQEYTAIRFTLLSMKIIPKRNKLCFLL